MKPSMTAPVEDFANLFQGRTDAYGVSEGGVRHESLTLNRYLQHLNGNQGIGIFPMRDDNTVMFCAIDLDEPDFQLAQDFQLALPGKTWIERSRSGNAHVWAFFTDPCPAWVARGLMRGATESVGRKDVEIFPKQDALMDGMVGNYINLPYHGEDRPMLNLFGGNHGEFERDFFVKSALQARTDPDSWQRRAESLGMQPPQERTVDGDFGTQPFVHMCASHIYKNRDENPLVPGSRSAVLFHVAVQFLNYEGFDEDEARELIDEINDAATEPLDKREVSRIFRNAASGRYRYTGCDDPLMSDYIHPDCPFGHE